MPTVLWAEADRELRQAHVEHLARHGFQVEVADSGLDCLAKLPQFVPDLIILDVNLLWGGADGVFAWLREERLVPRIAVLITATSSALPDRAASNKQPVLGYLPKPFTRTALLEQCPRCGRKKGSSGAIEPESCCCYLKPFIG